MGIRMNGDGIAEAKQEHSAALEELGEVIGGLLDAINETQAEKRELAEKLSLVEASYEELDREYDLLLTKFEQLRKAIVGQP